jgi:hypothetical protein
MLTTEPMATKSAGIGLLAATTAALLSATLALGQTPAAPPPGSAPSRPEESPPTGPQVPGFETMPFPPLRTAPGPFPPPLYPQTPIPPALAPLEPTPPEPAEDTRPIRLRGFVRIEGEYNDNFLRRERDALSGYQETLTPGISLRLLRGTNEATIDYSPSLVHSPVADDEVRLFHLLDARGTLGLTERLRLSATEHFQRTDEPVIADPFSLRRDRRVMTNETLGASLDYLRDTWSLTPYYGLTILDFETRTTSRSSPSVSPTADEHSEIHALGVNAALNIFQRNVLGVGYEYGIGLFKIASDFTGHVGRLSLSREISPQMTGSATASITHRDPDKLDPYNIYRADIGVRRQLQPRYLVEARVGYFGTDAITGSDSSGIEYMVRATYTGRWLTILGTSSRSLAETFTDTVNAGVIRRQLTSLEARVAPAQRTLITLHGTVTENTFLQPTALTLQTGTPAPGPRRDTTLEGGLEVAYRLTRLLTVSAYYAYVNFDSNLRGFDYVNNRVGLAVTAKFE